MGCAEQWCSWLWVGREIPNYTKQALVVQPDSSRATPS
jgi:hypothetical protein